MKYIIPALRFKIFMTILLGLIYPFAMTGLSQALFSDKANGEFISRGGRVIGAKLIGQKFEKNEYFWGRPSAIDYNPQPSGGSNLGQANDSLKKTFDERSAKVKAAHPEQSGEPPQELLFASASGLDPHISSATARYQIQRVALARKINPEQIQKMISAATEKRQWGFLGEETVNVLELNLALDQSQGMNSAPVLVPVPPSAATAPPPAAATETK